MSIPPGSIGRVVLSFLLFPAIWLPPCDGSWLAAHSSLSLSRDSMRAFFYVYCSGCHPIPRSLCPLRPNRIRTSAPRAAFLILSAIWLPLCDGSRCRRFTASLSSRPRFPSPKTSPFLSPCSDGYLVRLAFASVARPDFGKCDFYFVHYARCYRASCFFFYCLRVIFWDFICICYFFCVILHPNWVKSRFWHKI